MAQIEKMIELALKEDLKALSLEKSSNCPVESDLADYAGGISSGKKRVDIESHIADCPACMEDILLAQKITDEEDKRHKNTSKAGFGKNIWLILAIVTFTLSFVYSRYFMQLLAATLILGGKWIFDTVNAKILIMIYDAWKKGGEGEVSKVIERFNSRIHL